MNTQHYANQIRANILQAMRSAAEMQAVVLRNQDTEDPFVQTAAPAEIGTVTGYRYIKRSDAAKLGLPGELADSFDSEWFVDFAQTVEIRRGDLLRFGDELRRVQSARGGVANIYRLYRLEACDGP